MSISSNFFRASRLVYEERRHRVAKVMRTTVQMFCGCWPRVTERRCALNGGH
jgi:hypothetical protein